MRAKMEFVDFMDKASELANAERMTELVELILSREPSRIGKLFEAYIAYSFTNGRIRRAKLVDEFGIGLSGNEKIEDGFSPAEIVGKLMAMENDRDMIWTLLATVHGMPSRAPRKRVYKQICSERRKVLGGS